MRAWCWRQAASPGRPTGDARALYERCTGVVAGASFGALLESFASTPGTRKEDHTTVVRLRRAAPAPLFSAVKAVGKFTERDLGVAEGGSRCGGGIGVTPGRRNDLHCVVRRRGIRQRCLLTCSALHPPPWSRPTPKRRHEPSPNDYCHYSTAKSPYAPARPRCCSARSTTRGEPSQRAPPSSSMPLWCHASLACSPPA